MTETERKYLIEYPDTAYLCTVEGVRVYVISQTYLEGRGKAERRVRKREDGGKVEYFYTEKTKLSDMSRREDERRIEKDEYEALLSEKKKGTKTLFKTRYAIPYEGRVVEIDVYPFLCDRAIAEVELISENEEPSLPPFIRVVREVTGESEYSNACLAWDVLERS